MSEVADRLGVSRPVLVHVLPTPEAMVCQPPRSWRSPRRRSCHGLVLGLPLLERLPAGQLAALVTHDLAAAVVPAGLNGHPPTPARMAAFAHARQARPARLARDDHPSRPAAGWPQATYQSAGRLGDHHRAGHHRRSVTYVTHPARV
ncbi:hypothetical protein [Pseudofrankia sp. DC12]|uniref:hypothetical protein n=1 Tax=Pseudofrankia sp. DC12 TaxID=683315 RepID=UPI000AE96505|nr:hypothetical protein [Pseudofrankia sp. DC12]